MNKEIKELQNQVSKDNRQSKSRAIYYCNCSDSNRGYVEINHKNKTVKEGCKVL